MMGIYTDDPFEGLYRDPHTSPFEGLYRDPHTSPFGQDPMQAVEEEWYDDVALSIDPERGVAYDFTMRLMKDITGIDEYDGMQDYTYFGLPAEGAAPNILEDFE